jgi:hypothetical protein
MKECIEMNKIEALKRLDALESEAAALHSIIEAPEPVEKKPLDQFNEVWLDKLPVGTTLYANPIPSAPAVPEGWREAIQRVEEFPGSMPDDMWESIRSDRDAATQALRIAVRLTKEEAIENIEALPPSASASVREKELAHHLNQAIRFIINTAAFGRAAERGILQAGSDESTAFDVDAAKAMLAAAPSPTEKEK